MTKFQLGKVHLMDLEGLVLTQIQFGLVAANPVKQTNSCCVVKQLTFFD